MFCSKCGQQLSPSMESCQNCGKEIEKNNLYQKFMFHPPKTKLTGAHKAIYLIEIIALILLIFQTAFSMRLAILVFYIDMYDPTIVEQLIVPSTARAMVITILLYRQMKILKSVKDYPIALKTWYFKEVLIGLGIYLLSSIQLINTVVLSGGLILITLRLYLIIKIILLLIVISDSKYLYDIEVNYYGKFENLKWPEELKIKTEKALKLVNGMELIFFCMKTNAFLLFALLEMPFKTNSNPLPYVAFITIAVVNTIIDAKFLHKLKEDVNGIIYRNYTRHLSALILLIILLFDYGKYIKIIFIYYIYTWIMHGIVKRNLSGLNYQEYLCWMKKKGCCPKRE